MNTAVAERSQYRLVSRLSAMDLPSRQDVAVADEDGLLSAMVAGSDSQGRYFADPHLLRRLFWWQSTPADAVGGWLSRLVERGDVTVQPLGRNVYSPDECVDIASIVGRQRFARFAARQPIPTETRIAVFSRDGFTCLHCGSSNDLTLDHIYPWSLGGSDESDNLQTLCQPCNSRKGARIDGSKD